MPASGVLQFDWPEHPGAAAEADVRAGRFDEALARLAPLIAQKPNDSRLHRIRHNALMGARRFDEAVGAIEQALALKPGNKFYRKLHAIALKDAGRTEEALPLLEQASEEEPADIDLIAALCVAHDRMGQHDAALACGQRKLDLLASLEPLGQGAAVHTSGSSGTRDVVSFSLWGSARQYCEGAVQNARRLPDHFPGWTARFYIDETVPGQVVAALRETGAEVVDAGASGVPPLMRRFLVHDDPEVRHYLVRDGDSRIGPRELAAVAAWVESGKPFHAMRDHPYHTELMQGGMWGGTARSTFSMSALIGQFVERHGDDRRYGADQFFLGRYVWPVIRDVLLTHDSHYRSMGSEPFPDGSRGTHTDHVGMGIVLKD